MNRPCVTFTSPVVCLNPMDSVIQLIFFLHPPQQEFTQVEEILIAAVIQIISIYLLPQEQPVTFSILLMQN